MALYHKWDVKNDFVFVLQFFSPIFDGLEIKFLIMQHGENEGKTYKKARSYEL